MTTETATLPARLDGHWASDAGAEMARSYAKRPREELVMGDMTDMELANHIYMINEFGPELIIAQTAVKERIRWLSAQLALAQRAALEAALGEK
ncbi:MAG TPA: hypothetical protein VFG62_25985 [Rhodopila sp.]|jgi:hypothetical protein|nr:hypothetical protein [Rhodopila sp.]